MANVMKIMITMMMMMMPQPVPGPGLGDGAAPAQHRHLPPHRALHCAEHLQVLELETKVHTKVHNHLEGPY